MKKKMKRKKEKRKKKSWILIRIQRKGKRRNTRERHNGVKAL